MVNIDVQSIITSTTWSPVWHSAALSQQDKTSVVAFLFLFAEHVFVLLQVFQALVDGSMLLLACFTANKGP